MARAETDVVEYVEIEANEKVVHTKLERTFKDLGQTVNIWNVKTDKGAWWVIEGDYAPMNLYTQDVYYLSSDEAYSFHMGVMWRLLTRQTGDPESMLGHVSFGEKRFASSRRKLEGAAKTYSQAEEVEQIQAVGLMCRESLIEVGKELVIESDLPINTEMPKFGDFKNRARLAIDRLLQGSENNDLRSHARKVCDATWDFCSTLVHSSSRTKPEAAICLSLTGAVLSLFENLINKAEGPSPNEICPVCKSRRLQFEKSLADGKKPVLKVVCSHCGWNQSFYLDDDIEAAKVN